MVQSNETDETFTPTAKVEPGDELPVRPPMECTKEDVERWNEEWLRYLRREWYTQFTPSCDFKETPDLPESANDMLDVKFAENHTLRLYCDKRDLVDKVVMEIGCGCGNMGKLLGRYVKSYLGVDYSSLALRIARLVSPRNCVYLHIGNKELQKKYHDRIDTVLGRFFWIHQNLQLATWNLEFLDLFLKPRGRIYADFYWGDPDVKQGVVLSPRDSLSKKYPSATFQYTTEDVEELIRNYPYRMIENTVSKRMQRRYVVLEKAS